MLCLCGRLGWDLLEVYRDGGAEGSGVDARGEQHADAHVAVLLKRPEKCPPRISASVSHSMRLGCNPP
jgi:hypothetical protein